ncbi:MAG: pyridoxal 5'-phosphate synthase glutaminase subunit PdxT [Deltaproteobacteria bacterium]|nr:pyridoxal 5'-phosphate synthase glutaminase subunit PdxT [Deltaproteobacteria bacterium]MBW2419098.1 pyridoxal 5'-phosphate synthase glutaminase subunit PdxT [Deltaproteobacteria bacterium]
MERDPRPRVGVLAIQGDVEAHARALEGVGARPETVLREKDLDGLAGLVLPGGESTTIAMGLERLRLYEPLRAFAEAGNAVLGTCAGAILLARSASNHPVRTLGLIDLEARRNAYGTQVDSFSAFADPPEPEEAAAGAFEGMRCVFIRAPRLADLGAAVEVLARVDGAPVLVRQGRVIACSFHPELGDDPRVHALLLAEVLPEVLPKVLPEAVPGAG